MDLKRTTLGGVKWTSTSTVIVVVVQLGQLMALARLLSAREFGLVAMVNIVLGLAQNISDMGVSAAVIHRQDVTKDQLSTLYWINILFGAFLYLLLLLFSPLVAAYFSEPQLKTTFSRFGFILLINPIGTLFQGLAPKRIAFPLHRSARHHCCFRHGNRNRSSRVPPFRSVGALDWSLGYLQ